MKRLSAAALLCALTAAPALAAHPPILPTRDVAITYNLAAPGRAEATYQLAYDAADRRARIDDPAHGTFFLVDLPAASARLVIPALRSMVDAPDFSALTRQINDAGNARFTPLGTHVYAGLPCQDYLILSPQGSATACLTPDGVVLHFSGTDAHGSAEITATAVQYAPQPPGDFIPPDGFSNVTLPPGALAALLGQ